MKKQVLAITLGAVLAAGSMAGCGEKASSPGTAGAGAGAGSSAEGAELSGKLIFATFDNNLMTYMEENDIVAKFQSHYPDADIEIEKLKDDSEYWNAMKMRASANQLPDIMFNKPFTLSRFKDYLLDLSDLEATKNNELAAGYGLDGRILGLPMSSGYEYIYYWKDLFAEAGVEVPSTWSQLQETATKLQEYFGAENPDFMAFGLGAKDEWTVYPFMEFMPALEGGNGHTWNDMARQDEPFTEGTDLYKCYEKTYRFFTSGVFGKDPLGLSNDQVTSLFAQKRAAMIALGDWGLLNIQNDVDDISDLGSFYLPARDSETDPFRVIVQGDSFMSVTTHSKHPQLAKAFVDWFYSEECYPGYINYVSSSSSMKNFPKEKHRVHAEADLAQPEIELVLYDGSGDDFQAIQNETAFDYKKLGSEMFTDGFDLKARMDELNKKWKAAREKLGIQ